MTVVAPSMPSSGFSAGALAAPAIDQPPALQIQRFESFMQNAAEMDRYSAMRADSPVSTVLTDISSRANEVNTRFRAFLETPPPLPEGLSDLELLRHSIAHSQAFTRAQIEFESTVKAVELGTRNVQTLYQMQG